MKTFLCLQGLLLQCRHETHPKLVGSFLDVTLTAGVWTTVSIGTAFIRFKPVGFGSYMALLQITAADLSNVLQSDLRSTAFFEAFRIIRSLHSDEQTRPPLVNQFYTPSANTHTKNHSEFCISIDLTDVLDEDLRSSECHAARVGTYRRFGTAFRSHLQRVHESKTLGDLAYRLSRNVAYTA